jgi:hypothetical protein
MVVEDDPGAPFVKGDQGGAAFRRRLQTVIVTVSGAVEKGL